MRRDVCYYFPVEVQALYNAYLAAAESEPFERECRKEPYHTLTFGLNFSMKYNFNGGSCTLRFIPCSGMGGSAVNMRFTLAQMGGARYESYAEKLTESVNKILGVAGQLTEMDIEYFTNPALRVTAPAAPATPPLAESVRTCTGCGRAMKQEDRFCCACGTPAAPAARRCPQCGKETKADDAFCAACGSSLK